MNGLQHLPPDLLNHHSKWITSQMCPDGGFPGREGGSDLYYTGFALRSLAIMDSLSPEMAQKTAGYLKNCLHQPVSLIDLFSLLVSAFLVRIAADEDIFADSPTDWTLRTAKLLEVHRNKDGGYMRVPGAASGSTYMTFLVVLSLELLGEPLTDVSQLENFVQQRERSGGYVEIPQMRRAGTNPTAAAIGILDVLGKTSPENATSTVPFLEKMFCAEGGFRANDRIPTADLLSTFTAAWTISQLGGGNELPKDEILKYAHQCAVPDGGFRGGLWDQTADIEYTFYGLGLLGLLYGLENVKIG
ncbi:MAG: prenyltransferase/squalene oxidase repeat-containing protein [Zavarzinella sp.]